MASSKLNKIVSGSAWGIVSKTTDAAAKFLTIPILVKYYGSADYGLIALCFSLNAYLRLMDLGMNTGSIRFFSAWLAKGEQLKVEMASRSSMVFYGAIGLINAVIFLLIAAYPSYFFKLSSPQSEVFTWMIKILAISSVLNWISNVFSQLLTASNDIGFLNQINILSSVLQFLSAQAAVTFALDIETYFGLYIIATLSIVPPMIYRLKRFFPSLLRLMVPEWNKELSKEILRYGLAILAMGIFQFSADNLRPLILSNYASSGLSTLTDYRILQTISMLVISFGVVLRQVMLPTASRMYASNDTTGIENLAYQGTMYICIFISFIVFAIIANAEELLTVYMGTNFAHLSPWLILWLVTVLLSLHKTAIDSLVLSHGSTRFLVYVAAIACVITLPITAFLSKTLNVGAAVVGYLIYTLIEVGGYYLYYIRKVLGLDPSRIFVKSFLPPLLVGVSSWLTVYCSQRLLAIESPYLSIAVNTMIFVLLYAAATKCQVLKDVDIQHLIKKMRVEKSF